MKILRIFAVLKSAAVVGLAVGAAACGSPSDVAAVAEHAAPTTPVGAALADLTLSSIALFQGPKALLVQNGAAVATPNAPVIGGRPGLLRVYVTPAPGWTARSVTAELRLTGAVQETTLQGPREASTPLPTTGRR